MDDGRRDTDVTHSEGPAFDHSNVYSSVAVYTTSKSSRMAAIEVTAAVDEEPFHAETAAEYSSYKSLR